jgi:hypothetical protein
VDELVYLKLERSEIQQLLEEALAVASGSFTGSPGKVLGVIENFLSETKLHKTPRGKALMCDILREVLHTPRERRDPFLRHYLDGSLEELSKDEVDNLKGYLSALPYDPDEDFIAQIEGLISRIQRGILKKNSRPKSISTLLDSLERQIQQLSKYNIKPTIALIDRLDSYLSSLPSEEARPFTSYLEREILDGPEIPQILRQSIVRNIASIITLKKSTKDKALITSRLKRITQNLPEKTGEI